MKDDDLKIVSFGSAWVDGILIGSAILGLLAAIWLMADIMPRGGRIALLVSVVALVCLSCRNVLSRMAVFALRTAVEARVDDSVKENVDMSVNKPYNGPEWDITPEEDEMLDELAAQCYSELMNELWLKGREYSARKTEGLKCEYAGNWWKEARRLHNR